jgi:periplasmic protein CpxP/Spy
MKTILTVAAFTVLLAACAAPPKADSNQAPSGVATPSASSADAPHTAMQEHMKKMHAQMEKIRQTADPTERQKLMAEHMQAMHDGMGMMCGMGGGCMGGGMKHGGMMQGGMMKHHEMMEKRMDMMQNMMQQMLEHQTQKDQAAAEAQRK